MELYNNKGVNKQREPKPGEQVMVTDIKKGSVIERYFSKVDAELFEKYDRGPIDDECL